MKKIITYNRILENCYIIDHNDECFIVDPGANSELIKKEVEGKKILGILLTHGHADHIDAIGEFNVPIYIHKADYHLLTDLYASCYKMLDIKPSYIFEKLNVIQIDDLDEIPFGNHFIKVFHTPGHTEGSVCFFYNDKLFSGDTLFKCGYGRYDLPTGNERKIRQSIERIITEFPDFTKVYPGHDDVTTIRDERKYNPLYLEIMRKKA